jgi:hypothetical protein
MRWNGNELEKSNIMGISRQQSPIQVMTDQKEPKNVEYNNCSGSMVAKGARCACKIKSRITMEKWYSSRRIRRIFSPTI